MPPRRVRPYNFCMANGLVVAAFLLLTSFVSAQSTGSTTRPRVLELGLKVGILSSGPLDAITDVAANDGGVADLNTGDICIVKRCPAICIVKRCPAAFSLA